MRDLRELKLLESIIPYNIIFDTCTRGVLEYEIARAQDSNAIADLLGNGIDSRVALCKRRGIRGVGYSNDYPGNPLSVLIARQAGLIGPDPELVLTIHHKYYSRQLQQKFAPDAVPEFEIFGFDGKGKDRVKLACPFFIKPVKSYLSMCAHQVHSHDHLTDILDTMHMPPMFLEPFNYLLNTYSPRDFDGYHMIAESLLSGVQVTLEGYVFEGKCTIVGITDSIMYPGTISFERFMYPSSLSPKVTCRMEDITYRLINGIGLDNTMFNIEFMYDQEKDLISIIEVNPRMAHQFADLYEKVDGTNGYQIMLDIAAGKEPVFRKGQGEFACAASCVLRTFGNMKVLEVPSRCELAKIQQQFPDARIELYAVEGAYLHEQAQDVQSYRYAIINIGGKNQRDLLDRYGQCKEMLNIKLEPAAETR